MRMFFRPDRPTSDLFEPIRELRSPASLDRLKQAVWNSTRRNNFFGNPAWSLIAEVFAIGLVGAMVWNSENSYVPSSRIHSKGEVTKQLTFNTPIPSNDATLPAMVRISRVPIGTDRLEPILATLIPAAPLDWSFKDGAIPQILPCTLSSKPIPFPSTSERLKALEPKTPNGLDGNFDEGWSAEVSGGVLFAALRSMSEEAEFHWNGEWESVGVAILNGSATRDRHDIAAHASMMTPTLNSFSDQIFAVAGGAHFSIGSITARVQGGPALIHSITNTVVPSTLTFSPNNMHNIFGVLLELAAWYPFLPSLQVGISATSVIQRSQPLNNVGVSIAFTP